MEKPQHAPPPYVPGPYLASAPSPTTVSPVPMYQPAPVVHMAPPPTTTTTHVTVNAGQLGGCPICHNNSWTGDYSCCAWLLAICCFPVGILCCLCMRKKKCTKCGYTVG